MTVIFDAKKHKDDMVRIISKNHKEVIRAVSKLPSNRYNPITKDFLIPRNDVSKLINLLPNSISEEGRYILEKITRIPMKHQEEAKEFLLDRKKAILSDGMGFGKTFSSIIACNSLDGKKLIVCPSGLKVNWKKEIMLVTDEQIDIVDDSNSWVNPSENGWTILSYDMLYEHMDKVLEQGYIVAVFDEAHYCRAVTRNGYPKSKRAKSLLKISENVEYLFLLTGTPIVNGNKDLYILLKAIDHHLGYSWHEYSNMFCGLTYGVRNIRNVNGNSNEDILFNQIQYKMLRRVDTKFLNIPDQHRDFIPIAIDKNEYTKNVKEYMMQKDILDDNGRQLVFLNAMRKMVSLEKVKSTIELTDKLLSEQEQVVIFTNYDHVINAIMKYYGDDAVRITGKDSAKNRQNAVDMFQDGKKKVIVCNIIAGGVGYTMIKARHLIFNDFSWLPSDHLQAERRISRLRQTRETCVHYMYCKDTIDEKMMKILERRMNSIGKSLNGMQESLLGEIDISEIL